MASLSNVDPEKIRSTVSKLDGIIQSVSGCVDKFADAVEALDKGWVSDVKADFMSRYQKDWEAMQEMLNQYREISAQLLETANDVEKTEGDIFASVRALG